MASYAYVSTIKTSELYSTVAEWWTKWKHPVLQPQLLPEHGLRVAAEGTKLGAFVFILFPLDPSVKMALVEWTTANPELPREERHEAMKVLLDGVVEELRQVGLLFAITYTDNENFNRTLQQMGFVDAGRKYRSLVRPTAQSL